MIAVELLVFIGFLIICGLVVAIPLAVNYYNNKSQALNSLKFALNTKKSKELENFLLVHGEYLPKDVSDKIRVKIDDLSIEESYASDLEEEAKLFNKKEK